MDFPRGPVVKTPHFQCKGHGFDPWSGNYDPMCHAAKKLNKNKIIKIYIINISRDFISLHKINFDYKNCENYNY